MKKTLIAVAVAGAFAPALAMAQGTNVTLYGRFQLAWDVADSGEPTLQVGDTTVFPASSISRDAINTRASRLGFKVEEDLGGGMKALGQIEYQVNAANSNAPQGNTNPGVTNMRDTYVSLAGNWGQAGYGFISTPYKRINDKLDIWIDTLGANSQVMGTTGFQFTNPGSAAPSAGASVNTFDGRRTGVFYSLPNFSGFSGMVEYSPSCGNCQNPNVTTATTDKGAVWSVNLTYDNGPLWVGAGYDYIDASDISLTPSSTVANGATGRKLKAWTLGAMYSFGNFTFGGAYEWVDDNAINSSTGLPYTTLSSLGSVGTVVANVTNVEHSAWQLNAQYKMNNWVFKAQYQSVDDMDGLTDSGMNMWTVGVVYNFSKRTNMYLLYAKMDNDNNAAYSLSGFSTNVGLANSTTAGNVRGGADPDGFGLGMVHFF